MPKKSTSQKGLRIDKSIAARNLEEWFIQIERTFIDTPTPAFRAPPDVRAAVDVLFGLETQAYRESLLGCCLAKIVEPRIDAHLPYAAQGERAFSARTLDTDVVNPFLKRHRFPSSTGPYLSAFRRSIKFIPETVAGVRDKKEFGRFLECLDYIETAAAEELRSFLALLLWHFLLLRQQSEIVLARIGRLSVDQYDSLIGKLLTSQSGGRWPVMLATAAFRAISRRWGLNWEVDAQGINVADRASGAAGDITVKSRGRIVMAAEVTERLVDRSRVVSTFTTKIAEASIRDYVFFARPDQESGASEQARQYFAQGHEINFVDLPQWIHHSLITIGAEGRAIFNEEMLALLSSENTPATLKVFWNQAVTEVASGT